LEAAPAMVCAFIEHTLFFVRGGPIMPTVRRFGTFAVITVQSEADFARLAWIATAAEAAPP
jgi:hypothetical protein